MTRNELINLQDIYKLSDQELLEVAAACTKFDTSDGEVADQLYEINNELHSRTFFKVTGSFRRNMEAILSSPTIADRREM